MTDQEKKKKKSSKVTLIEDPFHIRTTEILDAQNDPEPLDLDEDLEDFEETSESVDQQMEKLAQAISDQQDQVEEDPLQSPSPDDGPLDDEDSPQEIEADQAPLGMDLDLQEIESCLEAILFISDKPLSAEKLRQLLNPEMNLSLFEEALQDMADRYQAVHHGIELIQVAEGFQFRTKPGRADLAQKLIRVQTQRLSSGSMETLAIIAYKQPVMKEEVDKIRGVDSSYFIRNLMDRKLIQISGRSELPGRPILYTTTPDFLEVFGLKDLSSMPSLRELEQMVPTSQSQNPEDDDPRIRDMRRLVGEMKADQSTLLQYNPREDEKILKEIKERVNSIPSSTPYLDDLKSAEQLAAQQQKDQKE